MTSISEWWVSYCRFCDRLREILLQAPWSSLDLIASAMVLWTGIYLICIPFIFDEHVYTMAFLFGKLYPSTARLGMDTPLSAGMVFFVFGLVGLCNAVWIVRLPFLIRLFARMGVAFCLLSFSLDLLGNPYPPVAAPGHVVMAMASLWSVWRTRSGGR